MKKIKSSEKFKEKIDRIMNGQLIIFIKHCKVNMIRVIDDEIWKEM